MNAPNKWDAVRERAVALMSQYVQIDTTNPPGNEMIAAEWLRDRLAEAGVTTDVTLYETAPGRGILVGRIAGTEALKPLVLNHHMDVVPADPAQWTHPPFSGDVADGYVWGRGTLDTKGLGIMHLVALEHLRKEGVTFRRPVIFLAVADEEVGGEKGMAWLVEHHAKDLDPEWVWDEGGMGLRMKGDKVMFGIAVAEKKVLWLRLVAHGEAGHGSLPNPNNPNIRLARALKRIADQRPRLRVNDVTKLMLAQLATTQPFPISILMRHASNPLVMSLIGSQIASSKHHQRHNSQGRVQNQRGAGESGGHSGLPPSSGDRRREIRTSAGGHHLRRPDRDRIPGTPYASQRGSLERWPDGRRGASLGRARAEQRCRAHPAARGVPS